jgi:hypothetical protein
VNESSSSSRAKTTGVSIQNCLLRRQADVALTNLRQTVRVVDVMVENDVDVDVVVLVTVDNCRGSRPSMPLTSRASKLSATKSLNILIGGVAGFCHTGYLDQVFIL